MTSVGESVNWSSSHPTMFDPFGSQPFRVAGGLGNQFTNPLVQGFGFGGGPHSPYGPGEGPLGTFIGQSNPILGSYLPSMQNLSTTLATGANQAYGGYQAAIDNFMKQLPGFQSSAATATSGSADALSAAKTALSDAMSPLQSRASFQEASRRALAPAREGAAARGMLESGQGQAGEQSLLSDLAFNQLQADTANKQAAISGVTQAAGGLGQASGLGATLAGMGPEMQQALFSAYPQLASLLTGAAQLPMGGVSNLLQFFQGVQNPALALLQLIKPQMGQQSSSFGQQTQV